MTDGFLRSDGGGRWRRNTSSKNSLPRTVGFYTQPFCLLYHTLTHKQLSFIDLCSIYSPSVITGWSKGSNIGCVSESSHCGQRIKKFPALTVIHTSSLMWLAGSQEFMNKIQAHKGSMNNGNIILCCINAQPTTGCSHRELIPLICDGLSAMSRNCMWRYAVLTRGNPYHSPFNQD